MQERPNGEKINKSLRLVSVGEGRSIVGTTGGSSTLDEVGVVILYKELLCDINDT